MRVGRTGKWTLEEVWTTAVCSHCGRDLVLGEGLTRKDGSRRRVVCPDCAARPSAPPWDEGAAGARPGESLTLERRAA